MRMACVCLLYKYIMNSMQYTFLFCGLDLMDLCCWDKMRNWMDKNKYIFFCCFVLLGNYKFCWRIIWDDLHTEQLASRHQISNWRQGASWKPISQCLSLIYVLDMEQNHHHACMSSTTHRINVISGATEAVGAFTTNSFVCFGLSNLFRKQYFG